jgi:hypothetical protein
MSYLVVVAPLKAGSASDARKLLADGPPFDLESSAFLRHSVHLNDREVVFVFESEGAPATLELAAGDPEVWHAAEAWNELLTERPRIARTVFSWERAAEGTDVSFESTPGPGDSDGGDLYAPGR